MAEYVTTVTQKGQVTIPGYIRKALNIKPKDKVAFELADGHISLRPMTSRLLAGYRSVKSRNRPEDFRKLRREIEAEIAKEVIKEA